MNTEQPASRVCTRCGITKPSTEFYPSDRLSCKECCKAKGQEWRKRNPEGYKRQKENAALRRMGFNRTMYDAMLLKQIGCCAICSKPAPQGKRLVIDHCHTAGKVRGLLCSRCNLMIGLAKDSAKILRSAARYLERKVEIQPVEINIVVETESKS